MSLTHLLPDLASVEPWRGLLIGAAFTAAFNWRAALMIALAVGVGQTTTRFGLSQAHLLAGYTLLAVVAIFFVDLYTGVVLAAFGLVIGAHIFGFIDHLPKVKTGEALLVLAMGIGIWRGPSGGLWDRSGAVLDYRHRGFGIGAAPPSSKVSLPDSQAD